MVWKPTCTVTAPFPTSGSTFLPCGGTPLAVTAPPIEEVSPIFNHEDLSNNGRSFAWSSAAAHSHPLLSQLGSSQGNASFGHNLPCDILVMLHISPQLVGGSFRLIFLNTTNKHVHQDSLLTYFNSAGQSIHVLPCPNFEEFL
jgi:hypothetical protein